MSERELAKEIIDKLPEYKVSRILLFLQGIAFDDEMEDDFQNEYIMHTSIEKYVKQEKINGSIYDKYSSEDYKHGIINGNIYAVIKNALKGSICLAFMENLDYKYDADNYIIPDVMIVCDRKDLKGGSYYGTPRFVVETLSPGTAARDRGVKFDIYEEKGVEEYWIVSPKEYAVEIYYLVDGKYKLENAYILECDPENKHYNADTEITLRSFPNIKMTLMDIFESVEE